jgi:hypothetical protein
MLDTIPVFAEFKLRTIVSIVTLLTRSGLRLLNRHTHTFPSIVAACFHKFDVLTARTVAVFALAACQQFVQCLFGRVSRQI